MQFDDVILGRRSIRGYKPDPVPRALIEEVIGLAMRAPSSMNTQPWNFCQRYFGDHRPASTLVEVKAIVDPRMKVEIEAVAYIGE